MAITDPTDRARYRHQRFLNRIGLLDDGKFDRNKRPSEWERRGSGITADEMREAAEKRLEELPGFKSSSFTNIASQAWAEEVTRRNKQIAADRLGVLNAASNSPNDSRRNADVSDLIGGFGRVRFTGAGGVPYQMPKTFKGAVSVKELSAMRARAGAEGAAYRALQTQRMKRQEEETRAKRDWLMDRGNYAALREQEEMNRLDNALRQQAVDDVKYAKQLQLRERQNGGNPLEYKVTAKTRGETGSGEWSNPVVRGSVEPVKARGETGSGEWSSPVVRDNAEPVSPLEISEDDAIQRKKLLEQESEFLRV